MESAFCTADNKHYDIASFSQLDKPLLSSLRSALICIECRAQGFYRKASKDGKSACFGAYHKDNCEYKNPGSSPRIQPEVVEEVKIIATNSQIIDIVFHLTSSHKTGASKLEKSGKI